MCHGEASPSHSAPNWGQRRCDQGQASRFTVSLQCFLDAHWPRGSVSLAMLADYFPSQTLGWGLVFVRTAEHLSDPSPEERELACVMRTTPSTLPCACVQLPPPFPAQDKYMRGSKISITRTRWHGFENHHLHSHKWTTSAHLKLLYDLTLKGFHSLLYLKKVNIGHMCMYTQIFFFLWDLYGPRKLKQ